MKKVHKLKSWFVFNSDCLKLLKKLPSNSIDSCVTDPPYGISFMGQKWDYDVPSTEIWEEVYRVLKPGAHLLSFFSARTYHIGTIRIENAGFEIRDQIMWMYGSGFPKSRNLSKDFDKMQGVKRKIIGKHSGSGMTKANAVQGAQKRNVTQWDKYDDAPVSKLAKRWEGWGSALKPAHEPIVMARKPLSFKTIANNVFKHGTGALNINASRIAGVKPKLIPIESDKRHNDIFHTKSASSKGEMTTVGRWPANVIHDGSDEVLDAFPKSKGGNWKGKQNGQALFGTGQKNFTPNNRKQNIKDEGSVGRFFYSAKVSKRERQLGLEHGAITNSHPTVKPVNLMRYLTRLVTPRGGIVLDPFTGSGSTGIAARLEKFRFIGVEREKQWARVARKRIRQNKLYAALEKK